jgi:hypothetical protein
VFFQVQLFSHLSDYFQANSTPEPLEIYKFMFSEKIASSRPNFYINWAWQLEQASNYKGAEKVS